MPPVSADWRPRTLRSLGAPESDTNLTVEELVLRLEEAVTTCCSPDEAREPLSLAIEALAALEDTAVCRQRAGRLLGWGALHLAPREQASDMVPGWDPDLRRLFDTLARWGAVELIEAHRTNYPRRAQQQIAFALAARGLGPWPREVMPAVARRYLNCPPGNFPYEGALPVSELLTATRELLQGEAVPLMQWHRIAPMLAAADDTLRCLLLCNYCGQDFRSRALQLASDASPEFLAKVEAALQTEELTFTATIAAALVLTRAHGSRWADGVPERVRQGLLWDLRCGSNAEAAVSLSAYTALPRQEAAALLRECLTEERAIALVPAVGDERVVIDLLARVGSAGVRLGTPVVLDALVACGDLAAPHLVTAAEQRHVPPGLAIVCAEALSQLAHPQAGRVLVSLLGHPSQRVAAVSVRLLERMGAAAQVDLTRGLAASKKAVRAHCERILARLSTARQDTRTPLHHVRERTAGLNPAERDDFLQAWRGSDSSEAAWEETLRPQVQRLRAVALELLRGWFLEKLEEGETRLWCYAVEELRDDPEAVWVAVDTFARMPKLAASLWARPRRALRRCGAALGAPIVHCLRNTQTEYKEALYGLLAAYATDVEPAVFLHGLGDSSKAVRVHAVDGLSRATDGPLQDVGDLLRTGPPGTRIAAAELLAVWGRAEAGELLANAWRNERSRAVRPYLEDALVASGREDVVFDFGEGESLDLVRATRFLLHQPLSERIPAFAHVERLPPLRLRDGSYASEEVRRGLIARLMQLELSLKGRVVRQLLAVFEERDVHAWAEHLYEGWARTRAASQKWAILQLSLLASDRLMDEALATLGQWRTSEHGTITCHLRAAQWHGSERALRWLAYWAYNLPALGARATARQLLERAAYKRGVPVTELRARFTSFLAEERAERLTEGELPPGAARESQIFELERAWLSGRQWSYDALVRLLTNQQYLEGERLLIIAADGRLCRFSGGDLFLLDEKGAAAPHELGYSLAHPLQLTSPQREALHALTPLGVPCHFEQLRRSTYLTTQRANVLGGEVASSAFTRWRHKHGWLHGEPMDGGLVYTDSLHLPARGLVATLHHSGYGIGSAGADAAPVRILGLHFGDLDGHPVAADTVPAVVYSELHLSLVTLLDENSPRLRSPT